MLDPTFDRPVGQPLDRKALLPHVVQRRRADVERWMGADTAFPKREAVEDNYLMSPAYTALYERVLDYCRESVAASTGQGNQQRVRYWAAIAILRCVLSSPAAAGAVLTNRLEGFDLGPGADDDADPDAAYSPQVMELTSEELATDFAPSAPIEDAAATMASPEQKRLMALLRDASKLAGPKNDAKLAKTLELVRSLLKDTYRPIVFCRFIATANYVAEQLQKELGKSVRVVAVTGEHSDEERRERIADLVEHEQRVLVATDCLSEGVNLQQHFDAVVHYDLPWNPNRSWPSS
ncbi:hypothetical protein AYO38_09195 [bacterium SCGC AG-212-C10]|nr:hypothetical protein AYO38_09195 [bacterium SCGC AG-212-C10]